MILGIAGKDDKKRNEVSEYISSNYKYMFVDLDALLKEYSKDILDLSLDKLEINWINRLNNIIIKCVEKYSSDYDIVFSSSLLEKTILKDKCDYIIKTKLDSEINKNNQLDKFNLNKKFISNTISDYYNEENYQLELKNNENWKEKVDDFFKFNLNNNEKISIVVPIYNTEEYLVQCVNSLRNQSYRNLEIILIDDGSTDNSLKLCNMLANLDDRIKVYHQENKGLSAARNKGIELATGSYIGFVDSDDFAEKDMYENLIKDIKKYNTDVSAVRAYVHTRQGTVEKWSSKPSEVVSVFNDKLIESYCDGIVSIAVWDKLFKKEAIENIRFREDVFQEDADFIFQLCLAGKSFACDTKEFYHYIKRNGGSLTGSKFSNKLFQLQSWGKEAYNKILERGPEYQDCAEKCLYNSLSHILKTNLRDLKRYKLEDESYKNKIQSVANDLLKLLFNAKNVKKFADFDNTLNVINELMEMNILDKEKMPTIDVPCVGIIWNTMNDEQKKEAVKMIGKLSKIDDCIKVNLNDKYQDFIYDIYKYNDEFEGIPYFKSCAMIDKYDTNDIMVLNLVVRVSNIIYLNGLKGYLFKEISDLKQGIRKTFKSQIKNYGYDTIFHLTVDDEEYKYTDEVCKKYIKNYKGIQKGTQNNGK